MNKPRELPICEFCFKPGHTLPLCKDEHIRVIVSEFITACDYSIAFQPSGLYVKYILNNCNRILINILAKEMLSKAQRDGGALRQKLYHQYYTKRATIPGRIDLCRLRFEGSGAIFLKDIDDNLRTIFNMSTPVFQPSCDREIKIAIIEKIRQTNIRRLDARARRERLSGELIRIMREFREAETEYYDLDRQYNDLYDSLPRHRHAISVRIENREDRISTINTCPICLDDISSESAVTINCGHVTCYSCMHGYFKHTRSDILPECSLCRKPIKELVFSNSIESHIIQNTFLA